jgi:ubiquinone/menaquinone biosynthesis C-methylase UbiE
MDPKQIVALGYDQLVDRYDRWAQGLASRVRVHYTQLLLDQLRPGAQVLDLGCGTGTLLTQRLAERCNVTGVDLSARLIEQARRHIPHATFIQADMTQLSFPAASFDAVVAFYSLTHLPPEEVPALLQSIAAWLRPDGIFVASLGEHFNPGTVEQDWLGVPMFFAGLAGDVGEQLVREAGLDVVDSRAETEDENGHLVTFRWIVAKKSS